MCPQDRDARTAYGVHVSASLDGPVVEPRLTARFMIDILQFPRHPLYRHAYTTALGRRGRHENHHGAARAELSWQCFCAVRPIRADPKVSIDILF